MAYDTEYYSTYYEQLVRSASSNIIYHYYYAFYILYVLVLCVYYYFEDFAPPHKLARMREAKQSREENHIITIYEVSERFLYAVKITHCNFALSIMFSVKSSKMYNNSLILDCTLGQL